MSSHRPLYTGLCLWLLWAAAASAETPLTYDRVGLSAEASREVDNDTLVAVLYVERQGRKPERLAEEVNRAMSWAVETASGVAGTKVQTLGYRTNPVYRKGELAGWRANQSLRLESRDAGRLGRLIGTLQKRLAMQSLGYRVSEERRRRVLDELTVEALERFQARARLIAGTLGREGYRLVQLGIDGTAPGPRPLMMRAMSLDARKAAAPARIEAGSQRLQVTVSGSIELQEAP